MKPPSKDPSVFDEPFMQDVAYRPDPADQRADEALRKPRSRDESENEKVDHTVWDEPALSADLVGAVPQNELTYDRWLAARRDATSWGKSLAVALGVALFAGPWAVIGALLQNQEAALSVGMAIVAIVFAPVIEEIMKNALSFWIVEKRPYLYKTEMQIGFCGLAAGFVFAAIENCLYLYVPKMFGVNEDAGELGWSWEMLAHWRWTVCVAVHMLCAFIVSLGLIHIWRDTWQRMARPRIHLAYPWFVTAMVIHGSYNAFAVFFLSRLVETRR